MLQNLARLRKLIDGIPSPKITTFDISSLRTPFIQEMSSMERVSAGCSFRLIAP